MQANKGRDTKPELKLRSALHARGYRFRVNYRPVAGLRRTADIAFTRWKLAVFVDGCFWHGCPQHGTWPKSNEAFWKQKIEGNRLRDSDTTRRLADAGWTSVRLWEHEPIETMLCAVENALKNLRER